MTLLSVSVTLCLLLSENDTSDFSLLYDKSDTPTLRQEGE
jgi:hypothetical protein